MRATTELFPDPEEPTRATVLPTGICRGQNGAVQVRARSKQVVKEGTARHGTERHGTERSSTAQRRCSGGWTGDAEGAFHGRQRWPK